MLLFFCGSMSFSVFQSYFYNDDTFNFNYAQATAAQGQYKEAEEVLGLKPSAYADGCCCTFSSYLFVSFQCFLLIQDENIKNDYVYLSWLARCCEYRSTIGDGTL